VTGEKTTKKKNLGTQHLTREGVEYKVKEEEKEGRLEVAAGKKKGERLREEAGNNALKGSEWRVEQK